MPSTNPPYLAGVRIVPERIPAEGGFPFTLPFVPLLELKFNAAVTFFTGENGSGKSTMLEAIAALCGFPVSGGGPNELSDGHGPEQGSILSRALRPHFRRQPPDGYFLRAEFHAHFASLLDARAADPDFAGNAYGRYGGRSLHACLEGEAFLALLQNRVGRGLYLLDEPESALSPQRQLFLPGLMDELVKDGATQFIVATHSPILMTYPEAEILSFDDPKLERVSLEDTAHFRVTSRMLRDRETYWKEL